MIADLRITLVVMQLWITCAKGIGAGYEEEAHHCVLRGFGDLNATHAMLLAQLAPGTSPVNVVFEEDGV